MKRDNRENDIMNQRRREEEEEYEAFRREQDRIRGRREADEEYVNEAYAMEAESRREYSGRPGLRRRKTHNPFAAVLIMVILLLLIGGGLTYAHMRSKLQTVNSVDLESTVEESISETVKNDEMVQGYTNIALFGVDSREQDLLGGNNRSDTIIIASINNDSQEIRLISLMRDTYLDVGDGLYTKCNAAYAYGGPEQAIKMINSNLDMNIVDFVTVGFEGLADTIDALGGIELDLTEEEVYYMNSYMEDMHDELGTPYDEVEGPGLQTVSGIQATAYCRIRYTEGDDFKRTERQRTVLSLTMEKARQAGPVTLMKIADNVMDEVATSLSSAELLKLVTKAREYDVVEQSSFPRDGQWVYGTINSQSVIVPDTLESNVRWLHEFLFGDDSYEPSDEVKERSETISNTPR